MENDVIISFLTHREHSPELLVEQELDRQGIHFTVQSDGGWFGELLGLQIHVSPEDSSRARNIIKDVLESTSQVRN